MSPEEHELELMAKAVAGDQISLQKLLVSNAGVLSRYADSKLPQFLRDQVDPDDIVQQAFLEVFRSIRRFRLEDAASFQSWLVGIADHVVKDTVKRHERVKRGGQFQRVRRVRPSASRTAVDLVEFLSADGHSPSYSVMGHEAVAAVQDALDSLPDDYRQAIELRVLSGKSLEETAAAMSRSPRAVQGLIDRAKKKMRAGLGRLSNYR